MIVTILMVIWTIITYIEEIWLKGDTERLKFIEVIGHPGHQVSALPLSTIGHLTYIYHHCQWTLGNRPLLPSALNVSSYHSYLLCPYWTDQVASILCAQICHLRHKKLAGHSWYMWIKPKRRFSKNLRYIGADLLRPLMRQKSGSMCHIYYLL